MKILISASTAKLDFGDLSFDASVDKNHPNRLPFVGTLLIVDQPSDQPPHGAEGHNILVPKEVAEKRLRSLIGMGVNVSDDLEGHDPQHKIGVITSAWMDGNKVKVKGNLWKKDFPEAVDDVKGNKSAGMSMELGEVFVRDKNEDVWHLEDFQFTGATILKKDSAAYWKTSLAASAEQINKAALDAASAALGVNREGGANMSDKDKSKNDAKSQVEILAAAIQTAIGPAIQKAMEKGYQSVADGLKASNDSTAKMAAAIEKLAEAVNSSQENILASIEALAGVDANADATNDATADSTKDATQDSTMDSAADQTTDSTQDSTMDSAADPTAIEGDPSLDTKDNQPGNLNPDATANAKSQSKGGASGQLKAQRDKARSRVVSISAAAKVADLEAKAAGLERKVKNMEAQAAKFSERLERKSLSPEAITLLAKNGYNVSDVLAGASNGRKLAVTDFDAMIGKLNLNLSATDKIKMKMEFAQAGILDEGIVDRPWMH